MPPSLQGRKQSGKMVPLILAGEWPGGLVQSVAASNAGLVWVRYWQAALADVENGDATARLWCRALPQTLCPILPCLQGVLVLQDVGKSGESYN